MTPFCARILIFPCATLAAGIKATPGSSANGCGLWGVAWARRQHATQPQETQPRLEPKNQCVHFVVSFTFFPLLEKKKAATKIRPLAPPPKRTGLKTPWLALAGTAGGGWPPGAGRQRGGYKASSSSALRREMISSHGPADVLCCHFSKKENPEQIWRGFHHRAIAVLFEDVTVTPPTEQNSERN